MNKLSSVSVVIPVYGCLYSIEELNKRLEKNLILISKNYQIIYVDDSNDYKIWEKLKKICKTSKKIKTIKHSRNFGQHAAIYAGLENSTSDWVIIMDCDLQDIPEEIPKLYNKALDLFEKQELDKAKEICQKILKENSKD